MSQDVVECTLGEPPQGVTELVQHDAPVVTTPLLVTEKEQAGAGERPNAHMDSSSKTTSNSIYEAADAERLAVIYDDLAVLPVDIATLLSECLIQRSSHPIEASKCLFERCKEHLLTCDKSNNYVKNVMNSLDKIIKRGRRVAGSRALSVVTLAACIIHVTLVLEIHIHCCNSKAVISEVGGQIIHTIEPINKKKMKLLEHTLILFRHMFQSPYLLEDDKMWIFHPWYSLSNNVSPIPSSASKDSKEIKEIKEIKENKENKENRANNVDIVEKSHVPLHDGASTVSDYTESTIILSDNQSPSNSKSGSSTSKHQKNIEREKQGKQQIVNIKFKDILSSLKITYPFIVSCVLFNDDVDDDERVQVKTVTTVHALFDNTHIPSQQSPPLGQSLSMYTNLSSEPFINKNNNSNSNNNYNGNNNNSSNNNSGSKPLTTILNRAQSKLNSRTGVNTKRISVIVTNKSMGPASKAKVESVRGKGIAELNYSIKNQNKIGISEQTVSSQYAKVKRAISLSGISSGNFPPLSNDGTRYSRDDNSVRRGGASQHTFNTLKRNHQSILNDTPVSNKYRQMESKKSRSSVMSSIIQDTPIRNDPRTVPPSSGTDRYPRDSSVGCTCAVYKRLNNCGCTFSRQLK